MEKCCIVESPVDLAARHVSGFVLRNGQKRHTMAQQKMEN